MTGFLNCSAAVTLKARPAPLLVSVDEPCWLESFLIRFNLVPLSQLWQMSLWLACSRQGVVDPRGNYSAQFHQSEFAMLTGVTPLSWNLSLTAWFSSTVGWNVHFSERNHGSIAHLFFSSRVQHQKMITHPPTHPSSQMFVMVFYLPALRNFSSSLWTLSSMPPHLCTENTISFTNHRFTHVCFHSAYFFCPPNFPVLEARIYFNKSFELHIFFFFQVWSEHNRPR